MLFKKEPKKEFSKEEAPKKIEEIVLAKEIYEKGITTIKDIIAPAGIKIETNYLQLGEKFVGTLFVYAYPRYIDVGWFTPIINMSLPMDIAIYAYPVPSEFILKQLRNKVGQLQASITAEEEKGMPRNPLLETALKDAEALRDDLQQGTEHYFKNALYITLYADSQKELEKIIDTIQRSLASSLVYVKQSIFQTEEGFNSTLPLCDDKLSIYTNMNTSPLSANFPFISSDLTSNDGILYGINRHNNSLILFDRFSLENGNSVIFAKAGAGKSYLVKLEVLRSMMQGTDVIIIDPEREYQYLSEVVGGAMIDISLNSASKLNPFDLPQPTKEEETTADVLRSAIITLKGLLKLMLGGLSSEEDSLIDRALLETYAKKDITPETNLEKIEEFPIMKDLEEILLGMEGGENLVLRLKKYTEGTFAGLLNCPTNIDIKNQLVVFSIRDLEDELRPLGMYLILNYIWNLIRSKMKKRILIIDEAWIMMQHEDSAKFVHALAKRCRKYYLGLTTITQDVNDFLLSSYGQAVVTNSSIQVLLKQSPASIDLVQKTFNLTEGEKYLLLESGIGEGIFFAGEKHVAIKVVASYAEDQVITTDPRQLLEIEQAKKEFREQKEI